MPNPLLSGFVGRVAEMDGYVAEMRGWDAFNKLRRPVISPVIKFQLTGLSIPGILISAACSKRKNKEDTDEGYEKKLLLAAISDEVDTVSIV